MYQKYHDEGWVIVDGQTIEMGAGWEFIETKFLNRNDFLADAERVFDEYVNDESFTEQITSFLHFFCGYQSRKIYIFGLREAFMRWDMRHLLNVLHQSSRMMSVGLRKSSSGYDHCINFHKAISAFAANDVPLVNSLLPKDLGTSKNGYLPMVTGVNLMMPLLYKDEKAIDVAKKSALKWLSGKRSIFEKSIVEFLLALTEKDMAKASKQLKQVCEGTRKVGDTTFITKMEKFFCRYAHGLYNFAYFVLPQEDFKRLIQPEDKGFIKEFAQWNVENGFPKGEIFFPMSGRLSPFNVILEIDQPEEKLYKKIYGSKTYIQTDEKAFLKDLTEKVCSEIGAVQA